MQISKTEAVWNLKCNTGGNRQTTVLSEVTTVYLSMWV